MHVACKILKSFLYSEDGFTTKKAIAGTEEMIPERLVPGLAAAGYLKAEKASEAKDAGPSPENKMADPVDTKHPLDRDGDGKPGGSLPSDERGLEDLKAEAEDLGIKVDKRWGESRLRAEIEKRRAAG